MRTENAVIAGLVLLALCACSDSKDGDGAAAGSHADAQGGAGPSGGNAGAAGSAGKSSAAGSSSAGGSANASAGSSSVGGTSGGSAAGASAAGSSAAGSSAAGSMAIAGSGAGSGGSGDAGSSGSGSSGALPSFDDAKTLIDDYATAHPGQDGDVTAKTPAEVAADPDAQKILALCGDDERPVIPKLVWEYGGGDHAWINPEMSALIYCVYIPVSPDSDHWQYDAGADHVTADVYLPYPEDNPCKDEAGADQVGKCIGDPSNFEILVDTASLNDGHDVGLELSEASTELKLILPDHSKVHLFDGT